MGYREKDGGEECSEGPHYRVKSGSQEVCWVKELEYPFVCLYDY